MVNEKSKPVKKEESEDEVEESIASFSNRKKTLKETNTKVKKETKAKKEEEEEESDDEYEKRPSKKTPNKTVIKKIVKREVKTEEVKKRVKKEYPMPGQKRDKPEERDPLRIFYESLYEQVPQSEMASIWMMESGLLSKEEAQKVLDRKQKKAQQLKLGSPMKTVVTVKKNGNSVSIETKSSKTTVSTQTRKAPASKSVPKQAKKRQTRDDSSEDGDDDFVDEVLPKSKKQRAS